MKSALLEFESNAFAAEPGEDEHTNPGVFGKALATWLAAELRPGGLVTGEVIAEDFGWCIPIESRPHKVYVACSSDGEAPTSWRIFVLAEGGLLQRFLGKAQRGQVVSSVFSAVKKVLASSPQVSGLREEEA